MAKKILEKGNYVILVGRAKKSFSLGVRIDGFGISFEFIFFWIGLEW